jgi:D-glycero-D-manno-heptose 1,7-bisphosphate phosphatase
VNTPPKEGGYVERPDDLVVEPAFLDALRVVVKHGYDAIVVTNQQGVGKSLYSEKTLGEIHNKLLNVVESSGLKILAVYYCPHLAEERCDCRKPKPGLLLRAADEWQIDLASSWMVGDSVRDVEAGMAAGCRTVLVNPQTDDRANVCIERIGCLPATLADVLGI